jgi:hypothetical protein
MKKLASGSASELSIQIALFEWIALHPVIKKYKDCIFHIPNEGKRSARYGKLLKDMGMLKGVSDVLIAVPKHSYGGAWIELKSEKGIVKPSQKKFLENMAAQNFYTHVVWGLDEAILDFEWYFGV